MFAATPGQETTPSNTAAAVSMVSFAIQQFLQLLDPWISGIPWLKNADAAIAANRKKTVTGVLSVALGGILVVFISQLKVLTTNHDVLNMIVSAFIVGAGTEASNTVQKLLSYTKDKIKPPAN